MDMDSVEHEEGFQAWHNGKKLIHNPYRHQEGKESEQEAWESGWRQAHWLFLFTAPTAHDESSA